MNIEIPMQVVWALVGYVGISTLAAVWWAAITTEQLKNLKDLVKSMSENNIQYARTSDVSRELGVIEKTVDTLWTKFEKLKEKVDGGS